MDLDEFDFTKRAESTRPELIFENPLQCRTNSCFAAAAKNRRLASLSIVPK